MRKDTKFWRDAYFELSNEVDQVLGKALKYPWYKDDQKNFPGTTEKDGVCTGEHVPQSLLAEAANRLSFDMMKPKKPLVISEDINIPCTAELEVKLQRLVAYFDKRAKENLKRSEKEEENGKLLEKHYQLGDAEDYIRSSYFLSGKADTYTRAAEKIRELLGEPKQGPKLEPKNEQWIVEMYLGGMVNQWVQSLDFSRVYTSKEKAEKTFGIINGYRARRIDIPEEWIVEFSSPPNTPWIRSKTHLLKGSSHLKLKRYQL